MADPPPPEAKSEQSMPAAAAADPVEKPPAVAEPVEKPPAAPLTQEEPDTAAAGDESGEADEEYVSDPDDAPLSTMRRRDAASDDEGSDDGRPRARIGSDHDDDGQGAPEAYADEAEEDVEYYDEEEEELGEGYEEEYEGRASQAPKEDGGAGSGQVARVEDAEKDGMEGMAEGEEAEGQGEEKEQEPFAVPTSGAFYMHDDRFQEENRGRRRRMFSGGRKLWDAKDDQAWVHDRFEEMNLHEERYEDKRMSRGRFRGRGGAGKLRGGGRDFARGGRHRNYHEDVNTQNPPPKVVRGRGPRRYEAVTRNTRDFVGSQRKQAARFRESAPNVAVARESSQASHAQPEAALPKRNVINSSLNSASPPFYPSAASNQEFSVGSQRRDMQTGGSNKVHPSSVKMDENLKLQSGPMGRGRTAVDYSGRDRFHTDGPVRSSPGRVTTTSLNSSGFAASSVNSGQSPAVKSQRGNPSIGISSNNQPTSSLHQTSRISTQPQSHTSVMQKSGQILNKSTTRIPSQQLSNQGSNPSSAAQQLSVKTTESGENGPYLSPNNPKAPSAVGNMNNQESGRGSFMYGGGQVIGAAGAVGLSQGDQNFPGTPALLPVMQFGGQHPGGLGVPTVGMALPGYVAQQQMGMGNNEMAWLPLLAGASGAFGGSYPPYIALDPSFYSRPSGQTSSPVPSREPSAERGLASPQNDTGNWDHDQRQNKPRRYSEMNFSQ